MTDNKMPERIYVFNDPRSIGDLGFTWTDHTEDHDEYIRADLAIPRADVMELVKDLEDSLDYMVGDGFHCDVEIKVEIKQAKQALTNFKQKYGETNE